MSSLGCKASCTVIRFFCSLVHLFNFFSSPLQEWSGPSNVGTAQVFIPFIRFLQFNLDSSSFIDLLRYSFLIFSFISTCLMVSASIILKYLYVSFSPGVFICFLFVSFIPSVMCYLPLFIIRMADFLSQIPSLYADSIFSLPILEFPILFLFLARSLYTRWFFFSCDLLSFYSPGNSLSIWLSGTIAIPYSNSDSAYLWNIPIRVFASAKLFPPTVNSTLQVFMIFWIKFMTLS